MRITFIANSLCHANNMQFIYLLIKYCVIFSEKRFVALPLTQNLYVSSKRSTNATLSVDRNSLASIFPLVQIFSGKTPTSVKHTQKQTKLTCWALRPLPALLRSKPGARIPWTAWNAYRQRNKTKTKHNQEPVTTVVSASRSSFVLSRCSSVLDSLVTISVTLPVDMNDVAPQSMVYIAKNVVGERNSAVGEDFPENFRATPFASSWPTWWRNRVAGDELFRLGLSS